LLLRRIDPLAIKAIVFLFYIDPKSKKYANFDICCDFSPRNMP